jgi:nucleoside-diphosphate-sugar epimerase
MGRLLVFGFGYTGRALARRLLAERWTVAGTSRDRARDQAPGVELIDPADPAAVLAAVRGATAVLITAPPGPGGCPALPVVVPALARAEAFPDWIGYLSSTGVYGDWRGRWVFEESPLRAQSVEGGRRAAAERDWFEVGRGMGLTVTAHRLPGIYGPGRSPFERLRGGRARRYDKPGQVFSRIHVDDVAAALHASIRRPRAGAVYNICDDAPAPQAEVTLHAARLLGIEPPPLEPYDPARLPPEAQRFYAESKRVSNARAKAELGWRPAYPSYREGLRAVLAAERAR